MTQFIQSRIVCNFCGKSVEYEYSMDRPVTEVEFNEMTGFVHGAIAVPHDKRGKHNRMFIDIHACAQPLCRSEFESMPDLNDYK